MLIYQILIGVGLVMLLAGVLLAKKNWKGKGTRKSAKSTGILLSVIGLAAALFGVYGILVLSL